MAEGIVKPLVASELRNRPSCKPRMPDMPVEPILDLVQAISHRCRTAEIHNLRRSLASLGAQASVLLLPSPGLL